MDQKIDFPIELPLTKNTAHLRNGTQVGGVLLYCLRDGVGIYSLC